MNGTLRQREIDWFLSNGVKAKSLIEPSIIGLARGHSGPDGIFEDEESGATWFAFEEGADRVFWRPRTGELATEYGRAFALGEDDITNPGVTAFGAFLRIHGDPLEWLQDDRRGIVVLRWALAFDRLRDVDRVAVPDDLLSTYRKSMTPGVPQVKVIPRGSERRAAA